jgi:hypothetical protein
LSQEHRHRNVGFGQGGTLTLKDPDGGHNSGGPKADEQVIVGAL